MRIYSIGEGDCPFRITKESSRQLLTAICATGSTIVTAAIDTTCPRTHACIRVGIPDGQLARFRQLFDHHFTLVEEAGGQ